MNDLLGGDGPSYRSSGREDVEAGVVSGDAETDPRLQQFFDDISDIKTDMQKMKRKLRSLQEANEESKLLTKARDMKVLKGRMESDINDTLRMAKGIKTKIERLDKDNMASRRQRGCEEGTGTDRTRMSITMTQKKKLRDIMMEFQELRNKINNEYKEVVERRYYTVTGQRPDPELVDQLIETGDSEAIFQRAIQEQGRGQLVDTIAEIQERHDAVRDIERQLQELHQIFMDMAVLVESQGEILDNIETNVDSAKDHVQTGVKQLEVARKTQLNTRKWMFIGIILLIIIIVIIVVVIIQPWKIHG